MKRVLLSICIAFFALGCSTLSVDTDYDTSYDFNATKEYAIVHETKVGENTLINDRIESAIEASLKSKGYKQVAQEEATLLFVYHVNVQEKSDIVTDYQMIGYGGYGFGRGLGGGAVIATPSTYDYTEGKLIIDALNPKTKKILWRARGIDELTSGATTPDDKRKYINKVVTKIMESFPH